MSLARVEGKLVVRLLAYEAKKSRLYMTLLFVVAGVAGVCLTAVSAYENAVRQSVVASGAGDSYFIEAAGAPSNLSALRRTDLRAVWTSSTVLNVGKNQVPVIAQSSNDNAFMSLYGLTIAERPDATEGDVAISANLALVHFLGLGDTVRFAVNGQDDEKTISRIYAFPNDPARSEVAFIGTGAGAPRFTGGSDTFDLLADGGATSSKTAVVNSIEWRVNQILDDDPPLPISLASASYQISALLLPLIGFTYALTRRLDLLSSGSSIRAAGGTRVTAGRVVMLAICALSSVAILLGAAVGVLLMNLLGSSVDQLVGQMWLAAIAPLRSVLLWILAVLLTLIIALLLGVGPRLSPTLRLSRRFLLAAAAVAGGLAALPIFVLLRAGRTFAGSVELAWSLPVLVSLSVWFVATALLGDGRRGALGTTRRQFMTIVGPVSIGLVIASGIVSYAAASGIRDSVSESRSSEQANADGIYLETVNHDVEQEIMQISLNFDLPPAAAYPIPVNSQTSAVVTDLTTGGCLSAMVGAIFDDALFLCMDQEEPPMLGWVSVASGNRGENNDLVSDVHSLKVMGSPAVATGGQSSFVVLDSNDQKILSVINSPAVVDGQLGSDVYGYTPEAVVPAGSEFATALNLEPSGLSTVTITGVAQLSGAERSNLRSQLDMLAPSSVITEQVGYDDGGRYRILASLAMLTGSLTFLVSLSLGWTLSSINASWASLTRSLTRTRRVAIYGKFVVPLILALLSQIPVTILAVLLELPEARARDIHPWFAFPALGVLLGLTFVALQTGRLRTVR